MTLSYQISIAQTQTEVAKLGELMAAALEQNNNPEFNAKHKRGPDGRFIGDGGGGSSGSEPESGKPTKAIEAKRKELLNWLQKFEPGKRQSTPEQEKEEARSFSERVKQKGVLNVLKEDAGNILGGMNQSLSKLMNAVGSLDPKEVLHVDDIQKMLETKDLKWAAKAAVPVGVFLMFSVGPELALAAALGQAVSLSGVASAIGSGVAGLAMEKVLDKMEVKNPVVRTGISLVSALLLHRVASSSLQGLKTASRLKDPVWSKAYAEAANPEALAQYEQMSIHAKKEALALFREDGALADYNIGTPNRVKTTVSAVDAWNGTATHNHPISNGVAFPLSIQDIATASGSGVKEMRAVTPDAIFVVRRKKPLPSLKDLGATEAEQLLKVEGRYLKTMPKAQKKADKEMKQMQNAILDKIHAPGIELIRQSDDVRRMNELIDVINKASNDYEKLHSYRYIYSIQKLFPELEYIVHAKDPSKIPPNIKAIEKEMEQVVEDYLAAIKKYDLESLKKEEQEIIKKAEDHLKEIGELASSA